MKSNQPKSATESTHKWNKSKILDFFTVFGAIMFLLPLFYVFTQSRPHPLSLIALIVILYPTLSALINGAPYVPTPMKAVEKMIKSANLKPGQIVYDLGCGDGRIIHLASKQYDIKATGFELSPIVYCLAKVRQLIWHSKAKIRFANFKRHNLSDADIIFCYLLPETLTHISPKFEKELKPGAKIISYAFPMEPWHPTQKIPRDKKNHLGPIWIYEK